MRNMSRLIGAIASLGMVCLGCGEPTRAERNDVASSSIINGVIDTHNPATVALAGSGPYASCSGTIIKVAPPFAYVLTAAHCVDGTLPQLAVIGHLDNRLAEMPVVEVMANPDYANSWWNDLAVVRVIGADDTTPVVPMATPAEDTLADGDAITLAGYGQVAGGGLSLKRRSIDRVVQSLGEKTFTYDQQDGGICFGDSGGPAFADLPAGRRVVGVTAIVSNQQCTGYGGSTRASSGYLSFIEPRLEKPTFDGCWTCFGATFSNGECEDLLDACFQPGAECETYNNCRQACTDEACLNACASNYPTGKAAYDAWQQCTCDVCAPLCDGEALCGGNGQLGCGFQSNDAACETCIGGCCAEAKACHDDGCESCFPNCDANDAAADALWQCLDAASCISTCGLDVNGGTDGAGGAGGGTSSSASSSSASSSSASSGSASSGSASSGSGTSSSGSGPTGSTVSSGATAGVGGAPMVTAQAAVGSGTGGDDAGQSNEHDDGATGGCSVSGSEDSSAGAALCMVALAWLRRRRRTVGT